MNLYAISHFRVQRLNLLLSKEESPKYTRGKHNNRPFSVTEESKLKIKMHIESFPYKISHYATKNIHYLDSKLQCPNEVCTFLNDYIINHISEEVQELYIFSDACPWQNKNNTVVKFLMAVQSSKRFKIIYHHFPIRGHSFLPCNSDFGCARRLIRRCNRVYVLEEYEDMIKNSRKKNSIHDKYYLLRRCR